MWKVKVLYSKELLNNKEKKSKVNLVIEGNILGLGVLMVFFKYVVGGG